MQEAKAAAPPKRVASRARRLAAFVAAAAAALAATAIALASYRQRLAGSFVARDLFGVVLVGGQVQFARGEQFAYRPSAPGGFRAGDIAHVGWNDPPPPSAAGIARPDLRRPLVILDSWPPLANDASILMGGEVAEPYVEPDGTSISLAHDFGWQVHFRAASVWLVVAPLWLIAFACWWRLPKATAPPGRCPACGYDLRASPERCPECGRVTSAPVGG